MAKDRSNMTAEELMAELAEADEEQRQAAQQANSDEARWTPDN